MDGNTSLRLVRFNWVGQVDEPAVLAYPRWTDYTDRQTLWSDMNDTISRYLGNGWMLFTNNLLTNGLTGADYRAMEFHFVEMKGQ